MNKSCPVLAHIPSPRDFPVIKEQTQTQRCLSDHSSPHTSAQVTPLCPSTALSAQAMEALAGCPCLVGPDELQVAPQSPSLRHLAVLCWGSCARGLAPHSLQHPAPSSAPHCTEEYSIPCWHLSQRATCGLLAKNNLID